MENLPAPGSVNCTSEANSRSDAWLLQFLESLPQLVWSCRADGPCDYLSPRWVAYTGISVEEQLGYGWLNQLHPEDRERVFNEWQIAVPKGGMFDVEFRVRRYDGSYRWFKTRATPICNEAGEVLKWIGTNTEIEHLMEAQNRSAEKTLQLEEHRQNLEELVHERTSQLEAANAQLQADIIERKRAEELLRAREEHFRSIFENNMVPMALWTKSGSIVDANDAFLMLLGYTRAELEAGQVRWSEMTPPEYGERDLRAISDVESNGFFRPYEKAVRHKDGHLIPILIGGGAFDEQQGTGVLFALDLTDRKQAEQTLQKSKERLALATEAADLGQWELNLIDHTAWRSLRHDQIFGYQELLPTWTYEMFLEHVVPEQRPVVDRKFKDALTQEAWDFEAQIRRVDGEVRWIWARGRVQKDQSGRPAQMFGTVADITERKKRERAVVLDEVFRSAPLFFHILQGPQFIFEFANEAYHRLVGQRELVGRPAFEALPEAARQGFEERLAAVMSSLKPFFGREMPMILARTPGAPLEERLLDLFYAPLVNADGTCNRVLGLGTDVTEQVRERKQAEAMLRASEERFRRLYTERKEAEMALRESKNVFTSLANHVPQMVWMCTPDGLNFYFNQRWVEYTGLTLEESYGQGWNTPFHPEDKQAAWDAWHRAVETGGEVPYRVESRLRARDGSYRWFLVRGEPLRNTAGEVERWFGTCTDIHEMKLAQEALLRTEKLAAVGRMALTVAHEINNPLAGVTNLLYITQAVPDLPQAAREYLESADAELRRIAHITRQALGFYRESNALAPTSVCEVLNSAVDLLKSKIKAKHAVVEKQWDQDVTLAAVGGELRQVFCNLLANSLDAIDVNGKIKMRVSLNSDFKNNRRQVRITIADSGKGISATESPHVFEPFFTTKDAVGTGLGLWVSKQLIEKHAGRIRMRSSTTEGNSGTVFSVFLPMEARIKPISKAA